MEKVGHNSTPYYIGPIGMALIFIAPLMVGWIALQTDLFPELGFPIALQGMFMLFGLVIGLGSGALRFKLRPVRLTAVIWIFVGIAVIIAFSLIQFLETPAGAPQSFLTQLDLQVSVALVAGFGIMESTYWLGLFATMVHIGGGRGMRWIYLLQFMGPAAYHEAVGRQLFAGTVFDIPGYFIWIGGSFVFYAWLLARTQSLGIPLGVHAGLNAMIMYGALVGFGFLVVSLKGFGVI